ncbi:MAG TPA: universal stress protein [Chitinophagaceae bacterium]
MRKVIIAFDGRNYSHSALEFARFLNEENPLLLTAVFAPNLSFAGSFVYPTELPVSSAYPLLDDSVIEETEKNAAHFSEFCARHGIEYRIHKDISDFALPELRYESRFADLMLVDSRSFYSHPEKQEISELFEEVLHIAECPVVILPSTFEVPQQVVLAYDGSEDSVYAIKQFAYLFPEFVSRPCLLVYANAIVRKDVPDLSNIGELVSRHFGDLSIEKLEMMPQRDFAGWLAGKRSPLLVTGSFGRSSVSRLFKKSFINDVIQYSGTSIFVAHR